MSSVCLYATALKTDGVPSRHWNGRRNVWVKALFRMWRLSLATPSAQQKSIGTRFNWSLTFVSIKMTALLRWSRHIARFFRLLFSFIRLDTFQLNFPFDWHHWFLRSDGMNMHSHSVLHCWEWTVADAENVGLAESGMNRAVARRVYLFDKISKQIDTIVCTIRIESPAANESNVETTCARFVINMFCTSTQD